MKRDLDLLREMMLKIESLNGSEHQICIEDFFDICDDARTISLHMELLLDEKFIEILKGSEYWDDYYQALNFSITRLTMAGYDYLDAVRNPSVWKKTKEAITAKAGSAPLVVIEKIAESILESLL